MVYLQIACLAIVWKVCHINLARGLNDLVRSPKTGAVVIYIHVHKRVPHRSDLFKPVHKSDIRLPNVVLGQQH